MIIMKVINKEKEKERRKVIAIEQEESSIWQRIWTLIKQETKKAASNKTKEKQERAEPQEALRL